MLPKLSPGRLQCWSWTHQPSCPSTGPQSSWRCSSSWPSAFVGISLYREDSTGPCPSTGTSSATCGGRWALAGSLQCFDWLYPGPSWLVSGVPDCWSTSQWWPHYRPLVGSSVRAPTALPWLGMLGVYQMGTGTVAWSPWCLGGWRGLALHRQRFCRFAWGLPGLDHQAGDLLPGSTYPVSWE